MRLSPYGMTTYSIRRQTPGRGPQRWAGQTAVLLVSPHQGVAATIRKGRCDICWRAGVLGSLFSRGNILHLGHGFPRTVAATPTVVVRCGQITPIGFSIHISSSAKFAFLKLPLPIPREATAADHNAAAPSVMCKFQTDVPLSAWLLDAQHESRLPRDKATDIIDAQPDVEV